MRQQHLTLSSLRVDGVRDSPGVFELAAVDLGDPEAVAGRRASRSRRIGVRSTGKHLTTLGISGASIWAAYGDSNKQDEAR